MRAFLTLVAFLVAQNAAAQMFKCTDAAGKTTYSSTRCSELGLKDAGEVRDRLQITPAPPTPSAPRMSAPRVRNDQEAPAPKPAATAEPEKRPERHCFTVHLAGGRTATRCNDKSGEE